MLAMPSGQRENPWGSLDSYEEDPSDFLQDPELWVDRLPQPFRTIDEVLRRLLEDAWEVIEARELQKLQEQARVRLPEISDAQIVTAAQDVEVVQSGAGSVMFVGGTTGLSVFDTSGEEGARLLGQSGVMNVKIIEVGCSLKDDCNVHIVTVILESGLVKIFGCIQTHLVFLTDITSLDEGTQATSMVLAPSCTHLAITTHCEQGYQLQLYQLPLVAWHGELESYLGRVEASTAEEAAGSVHSQQQEGSEMSFSKASLTLTLHPPKPVTPCTASDPASALQNVFEGSVVNYIATGDHHILSQQYFENRRRGFVSHRPDFVAEEPSSCSYQQSSPTCHFLYFSNACKQAAPCYLMVWWEKHTQLLFYEIKDSTTKGIPTGPHRVFPQGSVICATAVSSDSRLLAAGLRSGAVLIWDQKTGLCTHVVMAVNPPSAVSTMKFFTDSNQCPVLALGTNQGEVLAISCSKEKKQSVVSLSQRLSKQKESESKVISVLVNDALPAVVASVHDDGCIVLWSYADREPLCKLGLPQSFAVHKAMCTFSAGGEYAFIAGKLHKEGKPPTASLFCVDLKPIPYLKLHWCTEQPASRHGHGTLEGSNFMEVIEGNLVELTKLRYAEEHVLQARRKKRWMEFSQELY